MSNDIELPEPIADAVSELSYALYLLGENLRPETMTHAYIAGLVHAGVKAEHAKVWGGKFPRKLPFVIEFPCPLGHRTENHSDTAKVWLVVEENCWLSLAQDSPCSLCTAYDLERWMLTCPRHEAGEDSDRHEPDHDVLDLLGGDASPLSWVICEFGRLERIAWARWWVEHTSEAVASMGDRADRIVERSGEFRMRWADWELQKARAILGAQPKKRSALTASAGVQTADKAVVWLDALKDDEGGMLVPVKASQREALRLTEGRPGRPRKNLLEAAQSKRKSRGTEA